MAAVIGRWSAWTAPRVCRLAPSSVACRASRVCTRTCWRVRRQEWGAMRCDGGGRLSAEGVFEIMVVGRRRVDGDHGPGGGRPHPRVTLLRGDGMPLEAVQAQAGHLPIEPAGLYVDLADPWLAEEHGRPPVA